MYFIALVKSINIQNVCDAIIRQDKSIRFVGVCTGDGIILNSKYKDSVSPMLSKKETSRSAILSAIRFKTRKELVSKVGSPLYAITAYQNVKRATIYVDDNLFILISFDKKRDEYEIIKIALSVIPIHKPKKLSQFIDSVSLMMEERSQKEKKEAIGSLSAKIAHDMRNPLTIIQAAVDSIKENRDDDDGDASQHFQRIDRAIYRMSHQINDVLDYVKSDELHLTKMSIHKMLNLAFLEISIPENISIKIGKHDESIFCDKDKMRIVFTNVILNAIQEIKNNGKIKIRIRRLTKDVRIEFEDSGKGLNKKDISKVFEPLYTTKQHGTGLGLASCKNIVERHGGTIFIKVDPTIFTISLPL